MIVVRTPLRISMFGGGSDIPQFYQEHEGLVLSTTINSYIYLVVHKCVANHIKVIYSELEQETDVENIKHDRVREALKHFEITSNIEICSFSDVTVRGTGLGSSSTFTVGLVNALHRLKYGHNIDTHELAELASYIEINRCGEPIGKQDQYAAAYGGFNVFHFDSTGVRTKHLEVEPSTIFNLNSNLLCINTGMARSTANILKPQVAKLVDGTNVELTKSMVELAKNGVKLLKSHKLDDFGHLLDQAWVIKKQFDSNVTTPEIDAIYEKALKLGALGGKLLGAGGGGYLLLYVSEKAKKRVKEGLSKYEQLHFKFCKEGSTLELIQ